MTFGKKFIKVNLNYAYSLASTITNIVVNDDKDEIYKYSWILYGEPDEYYRGLLDENIMQVSKPLKDTLLHCFIRDVFHMLISYELYWFKDDFYNWEFDDLESYISEKFIFVLESYNVKVPDFPQTIEKIYDDFENDIIDEEKHNKRILNYLEDTIVPLMENLESSVVRDVFYLLFNNKLFLFEFNKLFVEYIHSGLEGQSVKRCNALPEWLKKAIYFRDNGVCQKCGKDLSGLFHITEEREIQFDHIIPLEKGGTNDSTNFQLLCSKCNLKKLAKIVVPGCYYQYYW